MKCLFLFVAVASARIEHDVLPTGSVNAYPGAGGCKYPDWVPGSNNGGGPGGEVSNGPGSGNGSTYIPDIVCAMDVRCCKGNTTVCVSRNPWNDCKFCPCPETAKLHWEKADGNKTRIKDKYNTLATNEIPPSFKEVFCDDSYFKNLTKNGRKKLKKGLFRELRGQKMKFDKRNEAELEFDKGGFKVFKGFTKQPIDSMDFLIIDDPSEQDEPIDVPVNTPFVFEDDADFKFKGRNFTAVTAKKDAANGWHKTTFKDVDTGEECEVDGSSDDQTCQMKDTRFEVYFAGSAGASISQVDCLSQDNDNNLGVINRSENGWAYTFNDIAYDPTRFFGLTKGTYHITDIPAAHPLGFEHADNASLIEFVNCTGTTYNSSAQGYRPICEGTGVLPDYCTIPDVDYCVGNMTITVHSDFNIGSMICLNEYGSMAGKHRLMYNTQCPVATPPAAVEDEVEDEDSNISLIIGGVLGGIVFIGLVLAAAMKYGGVVQISDRYDPIINIHMIVP